MITCTECGQLNLDFHEDCIRCGEMLTNAEPMGLLGLGQVPDLARVDEHRLKVDLKTPLEYMISVPAGIIGAVCVFFLILTYGNFMPGDHEQYLPIFMKILPVALLALLFVWNSSQYYLLDKKCRKVFLATKLAGLPSRSTVAPFDKVAFFSVDGHPETMGSRRGRWSYAVILVLKSEKAIRISDWIGEFEYCADAARLLADFVKVPYRPGKSEHALTVKRKTSAEIGEPASGDLEIVYEGKFRKLLRSPIHVILFIINAAIIIYALYVHFFVRDLIKLFFAR